jgi:hypothetical protein
MIRDWAVRKKAVSNINKFRVQIVTQLSASRVNLHKLLKQSEIQFTEL